MRRKGGKARMGARRARIIKVHLISARLMSAPNRAAAIRGFRPERESQALVQLFAEKVGAGMGRAAPSKCSKR